MPHIAPNTKHLYSLTCSILKEDTSKGIVFKERQSSLLTQDFSDSLSDRDSDHNLSQAKLSLLPLANSDLLIGHTIPATLAFQIDRVPSEFPNNFLGFHLEQSTQCIPVARHIQDSLIDAVLIVIALTVAVDPCVWPTNELVPSVGSDSGMIFEASPYHKGC